MAAVDDVRQRAGRGPRRHGGRLRGGARRLRLRLGPERPRLPLPDLRERPHLRHLRPLLPEREPRGPRLQHHVHGRRVLRLRGRHRLEARRLLLQAQGGRTDQAPSQGARELCRARLGRALALLEGKDMPGGSPAACKDIVLQERC